MRKPVFRVSDQVDTNQAVQPQKIAIGLKFRIWKVGQLYYPYSENKVADQLRGYREADLRLCFLTCKKLVFSRRGSINVGSCLFSEQTMSRLKKVSKLQESENKKVKRECCRKTKFDF